MSLHAYKFEQGYWTRTLSAIAGGGLVLSAAVWVYQQLSATNFSEQTRQYLQFISSGLIVIVGALLVMRLVYYKPGSAEFLIATDGEMRKVNWSSKREVMGSTTVVILVSLSIALILSVVDVLFSQFFQMIHILIKTGE